ncbi:NTP transferase domain-containing protein [Kocuria palustris]|uniref:NTP transferase domain-containing protein n=1 Tax=Kocuria palustris TaxID=71999 RepID=UPI00119CE120|nr:NTP transferase domain-containing protein [Kocuria palustris]
MADRGGTVPLSAILVAGGRSSRLGGTPKVLLRPREGEARTLVETAVDGLLGLGLPPERVVVVGPPGLPLPERVRRTREEPPFSGPASALAAGAAALSASPPGPAAAGAWTLTLACDMPRCRDAARALIEAVEEIEAAEASTDDPGGSGPPRGIVLRDRGIVQPLAAAYRSSALEERLAAQPVVDRSVRGVLGPLWNREREVGGLTDDVDTWDDVSRFGLVPGQD